MAVQLDPIVRTASAPADTRRLLPPIGVPAADSTLRLSADAIAARLARQTACPASGALPSAAAAPSAAWPDPASQRSREFGPAPRGSVDGVELEGDEVPANHPLRDIKTRADAAWREFEPVLAVVRNRRPRGSMNMKWVLYGQLLIVLYGIESDRDFCAELAESAPLRWFLGMRPRDIAPDWWEFARERRSIADSIIGRCFLLVVMEEPGRPRRAEADAPAAARACLAPA